MANVHSVAKYISEQYDCPLDNRKLQSLVYYAQAWCVTWTGKPLFESRINAWGKGPVVPEIEPHCNSNEGEAALSESEMKLVAAVLAKYGAFTGEQLSDLTHDEDPWKDASKGLPEGFERSDNEVKLDSMQRYYSTQVEGPNPPPELLRPIDTGCVLPWTSWLSVTPELGNCWPSKA